MSLRITTDLRDARLSAVRDFLDAGAGNARVEFFGCARPANVFDTPGAAALATVNLQKPCGSVASGVLSLSQAADGTIQTTGDALWARVMTAGNTVAFDADVSAVGGGATLEIDFITLYQGGSVKLISAVLS